MALGFTADALNREWASSAVGYRLWKCGIGDLWAISPLDDDRKELLIVGDEVRAVEQARGWLQASSAATHLLGEARRS